MIEPLLDATVFKVASLRALHGETREVQHRGRSSRTVSAREMSAREFSISINRLNSLVQSEHPLSFAVSASGATLGARDPEAGTVKRIMSRTSSLALRWCE